MKSVYKSGKPHFRYTYKDGYRVGVCKLFDFNGDILYETTYDNFGKRKETKYYYSNKKLRKIVTYNGDSPRQSKLYFSDGETIKETTFYKNGLKFGEFVEYYSTGIVKATRNYLEDKLHGFSKEFDESYRLRKIYIYKNGELDNKQVVYNSYTGKPLREYNYVLGKKHGVENIYDLEGVKIASTTYKNDLKDGPYFEFFGKKRVSGFFKKDLKYGRWVTESRGKIDIEEYYLDDKLIDDLEFENVFTVELIEFLQERIPIGPGLPGFTFVEPSRQLTRKDLIDGKLSLTPRTLETNKETVETVETVEVKEEIKEVDATSNSLEDTLVSDKHSLVVTVEEVMVKDVEFNKRAVPKKYRGLKKITRFLNRNDFRT